MCLHVFAYVVSVFACMSICCVRVNSPVPSCMENRSQVKCPICSVCRYCQYCRINKKYGDHLFIFISMIFMCNSADAGKEETIDNGRTLFSCVCVHACMSILCS